LESRRQVISALGTLSAEERADVVKWCDALGTQNLTRKDNQWAEHVYDEFSSLLSAYYQSPRQSLTLFIRTRTADYKRLLRAVDRASVVIPQWWPGIQRNVRLALLRYICRIVFSGCTQRTRKVGWKQLIAGLQELESSINYSFPGWLSTGLFQQRALSRVTGEQKCLVTIPSGGKRCAQTASLR
jgi:hypothetical protein